MPSRTARRNNSLSGSIPIITTFRVGSALRRGGMIEHSPRVLWGGSNNSTWGDDAVIFNTTPDDRGAEPTTVISVFLLRILANASRSSRFSARRKTEIFPTIVVIYRLNLRSLGEAGLTLFSLRFTAYWLSTGPAIYFLCTRFSTHVTFHAMVLQSMAALFTDCDEMARSKTGITYCNAPPSYAPGRRS